MKKKGLSAAKAKQILKDGYVKGKPLTEKQKKFFGSIADGATPLKKLNGGWLDKYNDGGSVQPNYNDSNVSLPPGFKGWGYDNSPSGYNPAWDGPVAQMGGSLPGATGMMYARTSELEPLEPIKAQRGREIVRESTNVRMPYVPSEADLKEFAYRAKQKRLSEIVGDRVASIASQMEVNEEDSGRPPLGVLDHIRALFDKEGLCRDNACVQTVKDFYSKAGIEAIPKDVYNNREFLKNFKEYGFEEVLDLNNLQPGDVLQYYYGPDSEDVKEDPSYLNFPYHMGVYVSPGEYIGDGDSKAPIQRKNMYTGIKDGKEYKKDPFRAFRLSFKQNKNGGRCWPGYKAVSGKTPFSKGSCQKAQNGGATLSQYEEPAWYEKTLDRLASPMTTLGYVVRGEDIPDNLPINMENRNTFDEVIDMINPAAYVKYAASSKRNFDEGNYLDSAFDALSAIPIIPSFFKRGKGVVKKGLDVENASLREMFNQPNIYPTNNPLPKNMEPYLSRKVYPFNKEQEIFESFLPIEAQLKNIDLKSIRYDADGNIIPNMEYGGEIDKAQWGKILKLLKNAYKYNPWAFKPNPEAYYRMIGKDGLDDAIESGIIRSKKQNAYPEPYFAKGKVPDGDYSNPGSGGINPQTGEYIPAKGYPGPYMVESKAPMQGVGVFKHLEGAPIGTPINTLQTTDPLATFYKQDWLRGYKKVPKQEEGGWLDKFQEGGVIEDDRGQWAYPGEITKINSNNITMKGVNYPVLGISDTGDTKMMQPGKDYKFNGNSVTEYPMAKNGSLVELDQLTNFTNYNTPQPGGWLDKY